MRLPLPSRCAQNFGLVRVHVCRAKRWVLRSDGHEPFSFLKTGCLVRTRCAGFPFLCGRGSICAQSSAACSVCLDPFAAALRLWTLSCLAEGDLRSLFAHGHCAVRASPSTFGYALLIERAVHACLLRGVSDWNPARLQSAHFFCLVSEPFGC
jgi:hypothetical protein